MCVIQKQYSAFDVRCKICVEVLFFQKNIFRMLMSKIINSQDGNICTGFCVEVVSFSGLKKQYSSC